MSRGSASAGRGRGTGTRGVRITGGELKGRVVKVPASARPTEGRVREALFSMWAQEVPGSRLLDLYAGSGAVAVEAVSRGALTVVAVEGDGRAFRELEANLRQLGLRGVVEIHRGKLPGCLGPWVEEGRSPFHFIFADPPYAQGAHEGGYEALLRAAARLLAPEGQMAIEHSARVELPRELEIRWLASQETRHLVRADVRSYGESGLSFYRWTL